MKELVRFFLVCGATYHLPSVEITVEGFTVITSKTSREVILTAIAANRRFVRIIIMFLIFWYAMLAFIGMHWL